MQKIIRSTGKNKTNDLIFISHSTGDCIVCHSKKECERVHALAIEVFLPIPFPLSHEEFLKGSYYSRGIPGFLIDNVDMLVEHISKGVPVNAITMRST